MGLSLDDVLDIKYLGKWEWSPDGEQIAYLWEEGGRVDLWLVSPEGGRQPQRVTASQQSVSDFAWHPSGKQLAAVVDGNLWLIQLDAGGGARLRQLTDTTGRASCIAWSPDGSCLSFVEDGRLWLYGLEGWPLRELPLPGRMAGAFGGATGRVSWSPNGEFIAFNFVDRTRQVHLGILRVSEGRVIWQHRDHDPAGPYVWTRTGLLLYSVGRDHNRQRDYYLLSPAAQQPEPRYLCRVEGDGRGPLLLVQAFAAPEGAAVVILGEDDGWAHWYALSLEDGGRRQLTFGECEDFGLVGDAPAWSPDGRKIIYSSNRGSRAQRQLWLLDLESGQHHQLTHLPGTNVQPKWSPRGNRVAFVHCDPWLNMDLWVMEVDQPGSARQLTFSMPEAWSRETVVVPEEVTYPSAGGLEIHAFLFKPPNLQPDRRYPALVWVHGGPMRQMRWGWHPMRSYAIFYAYHQYLAHRGYVSLSINFRGGIGYGRAFRNALYRKMGVDDVADVVNAARFLKTLPYVDPQRVGVWGLSYGGYLTLHCLTQHPDEFRMGINLAGIWDFRQWHRWVKERYGRQAFFTAFLGGEPEDSPELYDQASPATFAHNMKAPLVNFHGTADANVDFGQLDRIIQDCVRLGKTYEAHYYPQEAHTFIHRHTWRDAFTKIEAALERYLKA